MNVSAELHVTRPEEHGFSSQRLGRINAMMRRAIDQGQLTGGSTLVARHDQVVHFETHGHADLEGRRPTQPNTIYRIYSMTKPVTSVAVLMLLEEGLIRLTDPIANYIPAFKAPKVLASARGEPLRTVDPFRPITILDLLTHTAGLNHGLGLEYVDDLFRERLATLYFSPDATLSSIVDAIASVPLAFQPGAAWMYSSAPDVLGYLVQTVSGMPFDAFLQQRLFAPLGMMDTDFWVPPEKLGRFAVMYTSDADGGLCLAQPFPMAAGDYTRRTRGPMGTGGLVATTRDYYQFCRLLHNKGLVDGERLLSRKTIDLLSADHLPAGVHMPGNESSGFGLGVNILKDLGMSPTLNSVGAYGWGGAASTNFWIDPQEHLVGLMMLQFLPSNDNGVPALDDFRNLVYQALVD